MTPGVVTVVKTCAGSIIPEGHISTLQKAVDSNLRYRIGPLPSIKRRIRIKHGPLAGAEGAMVGTPEQGKFVIPIAVLGCGVFVEVDPHHLDYASQNEGDSAAGPNQEQMGSRLKRQIR
jgi:hypothetical protein